MKSIPRTGTYMKRFTLWSCQWADKRWPYMRPSTALNSAATNRCQPYISIVIYHRARSVRIKQRADMRKASLRNELFGVLNLTPKRVCGTDNAAIKVGRPASGFGTSITSQRSDIK